MVEIKGLEKFSPKDFPGYISSTVFLGGCNFRCPFCHNSDLVLRPEILPTFPLDYFLSFLDSRKGWLEGICISGGEPLLQDDLETLLILIKDRNLLVKIDINGSFPSRLEDLIKKKLVDHIAMDVKAPLKRYQEVTRATVNEEDIVRSVDIIKNSGLEYVFRTTLVPGLVGPEDIKKICKMLEGAKIFQLQQFVALNTLDSHYLQKKPYRREEVQGFARIAEPYFSEVRIEGV
ncbi:MAG TPA: anaerobic ribonucleoside-triphosphate reductase activating protein [Candidatus Aminicenantes bacterium]|nr:anaerobic ribonucleoside-triphosphate reductase activating protein [Candidatus Aminicenantes bacterium]HEB36523.1 anaerobic ribonucleoside-triphosphate reductase activating protein [Candidatus Aminicenantes bacterium]